MDKSSWFAKLEDFTLRICCWHADGDGVGRRSTLPDRRDRLGATRLWHHREGKYSGRLLVWECLLGWAYWPQFLAITLVLLVAGGLAGGSLPVLRLLCSVALMLMGAVACLAYMFIDLERNEVERGYKAVHNPLKGQVLARHLKQYGKQVRIPLLISATVAVIGGFALLNQGLYETVGRGWYQVADENREPIYVDFLAYSITRVMGLVDVLNLAKSHHILGAEFVRQTAWPASTLLAGFKLFFTMVLLHQIFASLPREIAGGDDRRFLEPTRADPREGQKCAARFRNRGHQPAASFFEYGHRADEGATGPASVDPGNDWPFDHPRPDPSSARSS